MASDVSDNGSELMLLSSGIVKGLFFLSMMISRMVSGWTFGLACLSFASIVTISLIRSETLIFFAVCMLGMSLVSLYPFNVSISVRRIPSKLGYALLVARVVSARLSSHC